MLQGNEKFPVTFDEAGIKTASFRLRIKYLCHNARSGLKRVGANDKKLVFDDFTVKHDGSKSKMSSQPFLPQTTLLFD